MQSFKIFGNDPNNPTTLDYYPSTYPSCKTGVVIFPGGAYAALSEHEGEGYAGMLNTLGVAAFVVKYRLAPHRFPEQLLDARRAVRFVRANFALFNVDKDKIIAMGSSAGGHLAALLSTYLDEIEGEGVDDIDKEDFLPNGQILCYPVISSDEKISHADSYKNLLGNLYGEREKFSPELLVTKNTPKAFIWHTSSDALVSVINSYRYAEALAEKEVPCELHVFPVGWHGSGIAPHMPYVAAWIELLRKWLIFYGYIEVIC